MLAASVARALAFARWSVPIAAIPAVTTTRMADAATVLAVVERDVAAALDAAAATVTAWCRARAALDARVAAAAE